MRAAVQTGAQRCCRVLCRVLCRLLSRVRWGSLANVLCRVLCRVLSRLLSRVRCEGATVRALSRINFVVFSQLVGVELPRGVTSIFVVPCKIWYEIYSKYHSFVVFFLLIPCGTCCHALSRNFVRLIQKGRNRSVYSWAFRIRSICGLLPPSPPPPEIFSIGDALNQKLYVPHAQSIYRNILPTIPPKSYSPVLEMLASGRLALNCAARLLPHWRQTAAKLPCIATN